MLRREIVAQVERLRGKLKQISGEAAMLAFDAECNRSAEFGAVGALIESVAVMHEDVTGVQVLVLFVALCCNMS